ncbi:response regulator [Gordoniibacillus kamchatkensis]|nr:response regulator [Paenibacillus sp. VKM B-2647]
MYRLLIVDNERLIVENLVDLFVKAEELQLEVYGAYSAQEALELMDQTQIDIVLSDIRMPVMGGLELQREIIARWPKCKVIFLSGYDDFEYAQQALRNNSVDYLLKTEGEQTVLLAVKKAAAQLKEALEADRLIERARVQLEAAKPVLRREYVWSLLQGDSALLKKARQAFQELELPLSSQERVLLAVGRVDDWRDDYSDADRELMLYAIQNIAEEYVSAFAHSFSLVFDKNKIVWMLQPLKTQGGPAPSRTAPWAKTAEFLQGAAERIRLSCKELLGLKLSFTLAGDAKDWAAAAEQFEKLKLMLNCGLGLGQETVLVDKGLPEQAVPQGYKHEVRTELRRFESLAALLENGQRYHFFNEYSRLISLVGEGPAQDGHLKMEIAVTLASIFLAYINRWGLQTEIGDRHDLSRLIRFDRHASWKETVDYYARLAESLFDIKWNGRIHQENDVVRHIQRYVEQNLAGDVSLTRIGEVVGLNPYYLSRLYKQLTSEGLSEYVTNVRLTKAKELLAQNVLKISDVSRSVGFASEQSFYRFFKKATGQTPQEYRESAENVKKSE